MNDAERAQLAERLMKAGFRPAPGQAPGTFSWGCVSLADPDGIYFNLHATGDDVQLIIVGGCGQYQVGELAIKIPGYKIKAVEPLPPGSGTESERQRIIDRPFVSIHLEPT